MSQTPEEACKVLLSSMSSLQMATVGADGEPHCGYTPFIRSGSDFIIFVSQLSLHTRDLLENRVMSLMLIADEQSSKQIFARTRVSFTCNAEVIGTDDDEYVLLLDAYQEKQGSTVKMLRQLPDFVLFRLRPFKGQFVQGFGKAFALGGANFDEFELARSA